MYSLPRRPTTAQEFFDQGILSTDKTTLADAERFLAFLNKYDLVLNADQREAYLVRTAKFPNPKTRDDYTSEFYVSSQIFFRICRSTGLWMPGTVTFSGSGEDMICYATCHARYSVNDAWVEVGAHARMYVYYRRSADGQTPDIRWDITPDIALAETAEILAARKALDSLVSGINTEATTMEFAQDRRVKEKIDRIGG
jgi:hypothetical protein